MVNHRSERGQVLVLIILAIVGMFGFAALAVDLGRLYAERRRIQSAADSAALAAAFAASESRDYVTAAISQMALNDVFDNDPDENPGNRVDVEVYNPPITGTYGPTGGFPLAERNHYYQIFVRSQVDAVFSQFVYGGPLEVTVESVARLSQAGGMYEGDVLHATSSTSCKALWFAGHADTHIIGGGAFSDSTAGSGAGCVSGEVHGPASCASGVQGGSGSVVIEGGTISTTGPWSVNGGAGTVVTDGAINQCVTPRPQPSLPEVDCSALPFRTYGGGNATLEPGRYNNGIQVTGRRTTLHLNPGMYCLNADLLMNGGVITGEGVFIYMYGGGVRLGGSTTVNLSAPNTSTIDLSSGDEVNKWTGMLIYMPAENNAEVHIGGGSGSRYTGTIYAPGPRATEGQDKCVIEGTGTSIGLAANVICYTIKITGNAEVQIEYDSAWTYQLPASMDLAH